MAKNIKETLLSTCQNGEEILNNIAVLKKVSNEKLFAKNYADEIINKLHKNELDLILNEIIDTEKGAKTFRFVSKDGYLPVFEAGQYINIFTEIDGVRTSRPYSLSSSPRQRAYYEITIAEVKDGFVSDYFLHKAKVGDTFKANGPAGVFRYNAAFHSKKSLFLAGGSGITPFISMLREILEANLDREVIMLYGVNKEKNALFYDELKYYNDTYPNFKLYLVLSDDKDNKEHEKGFITKELIARLVPNYKDYTAYICGPQVMNNFCEQQLKELNMPISKIRREMFSSSKNVTLEPGWPKDLTGEEEFSIKVDNKIIKAKANESILVALERNKIRVNVCCRSGECSLCRVKLVSGKVFLAKGAMLRKADEKYGYIHSCKAYPISDIEIRL